MDDVVVCVLDGNGGCWEGFLGGLRAAHDEFDVKLGDGYSVIVKSMLWVGWDGLAEWDEVFKRVAWDVVERGW